MAAILCLSSQVAHGHVGNSAMQFALARLGLESMALPAVILSNRPDYAAVSRMPVPADALDEMFAALETNGWLSRAGAVITGYLPSGDHALLAARWIARMKALNPALIYICDPVIGDEPSGVYIDESAACAIRDHLLPLAQIATPNRFELEWLTGVGIAAPGDALEAARRLGAPMTLVTSAPAGDDAWLANALIMPDEAWMATAARRSNVPHGTGDFLAAIFAAHIVQGRSGPEALSLATASMDALVSASAGFDELQMAASQAVWADPMPWPIHALTAAEREPDLRLTA